ncbi:MAG: hypothetical protein K0S19_354 [Geminicoccaceae bacterium]|nr:hypothetical protein [Geminicoccaceae bacterium]
MGRTQHDRLLIEVRCRGVERRLKLLHLHPVALELLGESRFRLDVSRRLLEDRLGVHVRDLAGTLLSRDQLRPGQGRGDQTDPDSHDGKLHASLQLKVRVCLEEIAQLEVELPAGVGSASGIHSIETIAQVHADRAEGRDHRRPEPCPPK